MIVSVNFFNFLSDIQFELLTLDSKVRFKSITLHGILGLIIWP